MAATKLQAARIHRGYKAAHVIREIIGRARTLNIPVMSETSLKTKLSSWENGHSNVDEPYRRLLRDIYGLTNEELGFPAEPVDEDAEALRSRLAVARTVDAGLVADFRRQLDHARHVDRRMGAGAQLDQLRSQIDHLQELLDFSTLHGQRAALAEALAETSALAGWEALDRNAIGQAWRHHEIAKRAAREAESPTLLAHATAQQAFVLIDLGETDLAVEQLATARDIATPATTPLLRAWLAAAHGEGLAAVGNRDDALRAFDNADALLPSDPAGPLPFLFLAGAHLDRWRGNALARLGEPEAIEQLTDALPRLPADFTRARTSMLVDLAHAHAAAGNRDAALDYSRQARRLATQIKSDRQLRRLGGLILPTGAA